MQILWPLLRWTFLIRAQRRIHTYISSPHRRGLTTRGHVTCVTDSRYSRGQKSSYNKYLRWDTVYPSIFLYRVVMNCHGTYTEKNWVNLTHFMCLALVPKNTHIEEWNRPTYGSATQLNSSMWVFFGTKARLIKWVKLTQFFSQCNAYPGTGLLYLSVHCTLQWAEDTKQLESRLK